MATIAQAQSPAVIVAVPDGHLPSDRTPRPQLTAGRPWLWLSLVSALVAAAGNVVALARVGDVYGRETSAFIDQAVAQDVVNLIVVAPATIVLALLALLARRGALTAHLLWLGVMSFLVYNYVIYTLSVHAGMLYLPWVAVLGMSLYALVGGMATLDAASVRAGFATASNHSAGWFLVVVSVAFTMLWLGDIVPALMSGEVPAGARQLGLPSSPVHVLDLAFFLPATCAAGIALLRHRSWGYLIAPGLLVFLALTGLPILLTPFVASVRGGSPTWAVLVPVGAVTVLSIVILIRLLSAARPTTVEEGSHAH